MLNHITALKTCHFFFVSTLHLSRAHYRQVIGQLRPLILGDTPPPLGLIALYLPEPSGKRETGCARFFRINLLQRNKDSSRFLSNVFSKVISLTAMRPNLSDISKKKTPSPLGLLFYKWNDVIYIPLYTCKSFVILCERI